MFIITLSVTILLAAEALASGFLMIVVKDSLCGGVPSPSRFAIGRTESAIKVVEIESHFL